MMKYILEKLYMIRQLGVKLDRESALMKNAKVSSSKKVNTDVSLELSVFSISYLSSAKAVDQTIVKLLELPTPM